MSDASRDSIGSEHGDCQPWAQHLNSREVFVECWAQHLNSRVIVGLGLDTSGLSIAELLAARKMTLVRVRLSSFKRSEC